MSNATSEQNNIIFYEMMSHPALFTHSHPQKVIIIGDENGHILQEVKKHEQLTEIIVIKKNSSANNADPRIIYYSDASTDWTKEITPHSIDIIIHAAQPNNALLKNYFNLLQDDGFLIQQSASPFEMVIVKTLADELRSAGFKDQHILNFPQPSFSSGWRSIILATKQAGFKRIREKAIFTKSFKTYYYNLDTHKASLVLPEFMREEWAI